MVSKRVILGAFLFSFSLPIFLYFGGLFHERALDMRLVIGNSALPASLAIYHLISNAHSWNSCEIFPNIQNCARCEDLKDNKHDSLHLERKDPIGYLSMEMICSSELSVFLELCSPKA